MEIKGSRLSPTYNHNSISPPQSVRKSNALKALRETREKEKITTIHAVQVILEIS